MASAFFLFMFFFTVGAGLGLAFVVNFLRDNSFMEPRKPNYDDLFKILKGATITKVKKTEKGDEGFVFYFDKQGSQNQSVEVAFSYAEGSIFFNHAELVDTAT